MEGRQSIRVGTGIGCFSTLWCPWETRCTPHSRFKAPSSTPPTVCKYSLIQLPEAALIHPPAHEPSVTPSFLLGQVQGCSQLFPAFPTSSGPGTHLLGLPVFLTSLPLKRLLLPSSQLPVSPPWTAWYIASKVHVHPKALFLLFLLSPPCHLSVLIGCSHFLLVFSLTHARSEARYPFTPSFYP